MQRISTVILPARPDCSRNCARDGAALTGGDSGEAERSFRREAERYSGMIPNAIGA